MKQDNTSLSSVHSTANDFECPVCDSKAVDTHWRTETFSYGLPDSAVMLRVELPLRHCSTCEFEFIDDEGEQLKHAAVCRHLGVLTPAEVRAARERHKMTRTAFAEATALGEATGSRRSDPEPGLRFLPAASPHAWGHVDSPEIFDLEVQAIRCR